MNPELAEAYYNRGVVYEHTGEFEHAIEDHTKAIELQPNYAEAYNNWGTVYNKKDEVDLAIKDFSKAIELKPGFAYASGGRGYAYYAKGEFDRAIVDYNKTIEFNSNFAEGYNYLGLAQFAKGELELAIKDLDKAIESNPNYAVAYYNRGAVWSKLQQWENDEKHRKVVKHLEMIQAVINRLGKNSFWVKGGSLEIIITTAIFIPQFSNTSDQRPSWCLYNTIVVFIHYDFLLARIISAPYSVRLHYGNF